MASNTQNGTTNAKVAQLATEKAQLDRTALIGIFGSSNRPGALVRESNGRVTRVGVGDRIDGALVSAIGETRLVLSQRRGTKILELPSS